ncbi:hypothetical protein K523DRAFT_165209 [Schizophyllum commune Tattone D]|nr:hypothetical protein K523DRAFT_165209 [Schizophyllum commune Tattone D]
MDEDLAISARNETITVVGTDAGAQRNDKVESRPTPSSSHHQSRRIVIHSLQAPVRSRHSPSHFVAQTSAHDSQSQTRLALAPFSLALTHLAHTHRNGWPVQWYQGLGLELWLVRSQGRRVVDRRRVLLSTQAPPTRPPLPHVQHTIHSPPILPRCASPPPPPPSIYHGRPRSAYTLSSPNLPGCPPWAEPMKTRREGGEAGQGAPRLRQDTHHRSPSPIDTSHLLRTR